jgi:outer membrane protein OmpA-like peptidoglycan-associated protein
LIVREKLESVGVSKIKVKVEAYADTKPLEAKVLANLPRTDQLAKHRRVVIRLY